MSGSSSLREHRSRVCGVAWGRLASAVAASGTGLLLAACVTGGALSGDPAARAGGLVTVGDWNRCAGEGACPFRIDGRPDAPATGVSWDDARLYLGWLSARAGRSHRLPRLAEWTPRGGDIAEWLEDCHPVSDAAPGAPCSHRLVRPVSEGGPDALSPSLRLSDVGFGVVRD
ncbi:MAG: SUMF1/EgtB/PvdO family nonheme iron enzyme [Brevundimonas sp.]